MIEFFDTTVLVAAMVEDEPRHEACAQALEETTDGYAAIHSLAECYATLTGGRLGVHLSPARQRRLTMSRHNPSATSPAMRTLVSTSNFTRRR